MEELNATGLTICDWCDAFSIDGSCILEVGIKRPAGCKYREGDDVD